MSAKFRILEINVKYKNEEYKRVLDYVRDVAPDFLLLEEFTPQWRDAVASDLSKQFPYKVEVVRDDPYGIAIFSRSKIMTNETIHLADIGWPSIDCTVPFQNQTLRIFSAHITGPVTIDSRNAQSKLLKDLQSKIASTANLIVCGDFNMTPWSTEFQQFLSAAHLSDSRNGFGLQCSWPTEKPIVVSKVIKMPMRIELQGVNWLVMLPIDHCLIGNELAVADRRIGPYLGSDHFPVLIDIQWAQKIESAVLK
jgi:endonuclease/exonuclease/phosphatase (EEP) superfamily protein YafD